MSITDYVIQNVMEGIGIARRSSIFRGKLDTFSKNLTTLFISFLCKICTSASRHHWYPCTTEINRSPPCMNGCSSEYSFEDTEVRIRDGDQAVEFNWFKP